jgi:ribosomal protein S6--L-glutamate ligase
MKILIYATEPGHSTRRLMEEIEKANKRTPEKEISGEVVAVYDLHSYCSEHTNRDRVYKRAAGKSQKLIQKEYSAVIPRLAGAGFDFGLINLRHLNRNLNIFSTGTDTGLRICSNKFQTIQTLSEHGLRVPRHVLAHRPTDYKEILSLVGWPEKVVAKMQRGSQGAGVFILNDTLAASTALRAMEQAQVDCVLTRFIDTGTPANDLRIITIGAETENPKVFAYKRFSVDGDFRSNYSLSGKGEKVELTDEEREMALNASKLLGGGVHGIDIMRDAKDGNKPYIIESNGCPGLAGIEAVTGANVAGAIIQYVLDNYQRNGKRKVTDASGATATQKNHKVNSFSNGFTKEEIELTKNLGVTN